MTSTSHYKTSNERCVVALICSITTALYYVIYTPLRILWRCLNNRLTPMDISRGSATYSTEPSNIWFLKNSASKQHKSHIISINIQEYKQVTMRMIMT